MSARLLDAVRAFVEEVADEVEIDPKSPIGQLAAVARREWAEALPPLPAAARAKDLQIARLVEALSGFRKPGGHYAGCPADKQGGLCSEACRRGQLALEPGIRGDAGATVDRLQGELDALRREYSRLRERLYRERENYRKVIRRATAETGFQVRKAGRPRKSARDAHPAVAAGTQAAPGL